MWRVLGSIGIIVAALLLFPVVLMFVVRLRSRIDFNYAMRHLAQRAVWLARREQGVTLDYSPGSIERVESILSALHDRHAENPMSDRELSILSARWGAYIGEVLKRTQPGKWQRDSPKLGPGTMPVIFHSKHQAFPCSWAYKRIADGPGDNVFLKFRVLCDLQFQKQTGDTQAVIVDETPYQKE